MAIVLEQLHCVPVKEMAAGGQCDTRGSDMEVLIQRLNSGYAYSEVLVGVFQQWQQMGRFCWCRFLQVWHAESCSLLVKMYSQW